LLGLAVVSALLSVLLIGNSTRARADTVVGPTAGSFSVHGAGWGHGWGMSQYGAYGAALQGLTWPRILAFYYPGTVRTILPARSRLNVWVTGDNDGSLRVLPSEGLNVRDGVGGRFTVPTGSTYLSWRISRYGTGYRLSYRTADGRNVVQRTGLSTGTWSFYSPSKFVRVVMPSGYIRSYRGSMALIKWGSSGRTVNRVRVEDYVRGVVPAEMPTSWPANAVRAQAVAARSYAVRLRTTRRYAGYDLCDTTACQVYRGMSAETERGDAAVRATAGTILTYRGAVALTQFASSNGGHSAQGDYPYLRAQPDPYDGVVRSQAWTRTITATQIERGWPSVARSAGCRSRLGTAPAPGAAGSAPSRSSAAAAR
jgi:stage II sporulation protein D